MHSCCYERLNWCECSTLSEISNVRIVRNGVPVIDYNTIDSTQVFVKTINSLHFDRDGPLINLSNYNNHFFMVFDLTSTQESQSEVYYPEVVGSSLKLELNFTAALADTYELLVFGEKLTTLLIDQSGKVIKNG